MRRLIPRLLVLVLSFSTSLTNPAYALRTQQRERPAQTAGLEESLRGEPSGEKLTWRAWWATLGAWGPANEVLRQFDESTRRVLRGQINRLIKQLVKQGVDPQPLLKGELLQALAKISPTSEAFQVALQLVARYFTRLDGNEHDLWHTLPEIAQVSPTLEVFQANLRALTGIRIHVPKGAVHHYAVTGYLSPPHKFPKEVLAMYLQPLESLITRLAERKINFWHILDVGLPAVMRASATSEELSIGMDFLFKLGANQQLERIVWNKVESDKLGQLVQEAVRLHEQRINYEVEVIPEQAHWFIIRPAREEVVPGHWEYPAPEEYMSVAELNEAIWVEDYTSTLDLGEREYIVDRPQEIRIIPLLGTPMPPAAGLEESLRLDENVEKVRQLLQGPFDDQRVEGLTRVLDWASRWDSLDLALRQSIASRFGTLVSLVEANTWYTDFRQDSRTVPKGRWSGQPNDDVGIEPELVDVGEHVRELAGRTLSALNRLPLNTPSAGLEESKIEVPSSEPMVIPMRFVVDTAGGDPEVLNFARWATLLVRKGAMVRFAGVATAWELDQVKKRIPEAADLLEDYIQIYDPNDPASHQAALDLAKTAAFGDAVNASSEFVITKTDPVMIRWFLDELDRLGINDSIAPDLREEIRSYLTAA